MQCICDSLSSLNSTV